MKSHKSQTGFSLIELLIVVAVVGIISAIAVPNLLSSRRSANEAGALSALRTISSSEATYQVSAGAGSYADLATLRNNGLVDQAVAAATIAGPGTPKAGYLFSATNIAIAGLPAFDAISQPVVHTSASSLFATGARSFIVNEAGVMWFNTTDTAPTCTATSARTVTAGTGGGVLN
jgi:prepilin-type N-terminal cleavage/methylation domain-containing protein